MMEKKHFSAQVQEKLDLVEKISQNLDKLTEAPPSLDRLSQLTPEEANKVLEEVLQSSLQSKDYLYQIRKLVSLFQKLRNVFQGSEIRQSVESSLAGLAAVESNMLVLVNRGDYKPEVVQRTVENWKYSIIDDVGSRLQIPENENTELKKEIIKWLIFADEIPQINLILLDFFAQLPVEVDDDTKTHDLRLIKQALQGQPLTEQPEAIQIKEVGKLTYNDVLQAFNVGFKKLKDQGVPSLSQSARLILTKLHEHGGQLTVEELAREMQVVQSTLRTYISIVRRALREGGISQPHQVLVTRGRGANSIVQLRFSTILAGKGRERHRVNEQQRFLFKEEYKFLAKLVKLDVDKLARLLIEAGLVNQELFIKRLNESQPILATRLKDESGDNLLEMLKGWLQSVLDEVRQDIKIEFRFPDLADLEEILSNGSEQNNISPGDLTIFHGLCERIRAFNYESDLFQTTEILLNIHRLLAKLDLILTNPTTEQGGFEIFETAVQILVAKEPPEDLVSVLDSVKTFLLNNAGDILFLLSLSKNDSQLSASLKQLLVLKDVGDAAYADYSEEEISTLLKLVREGLNEQLSKLRAFNLKLYKHVLNQEQSNLISTSQSLLRALRRLKQQLSQQVSKRNDPDTNREPVDPTVYENKVLHLNSSNGGGEAIKMSVGQIELPQFFGFGKDVTVRLVKYSDVYVGELIPEKLVGELNSVSKEVKDQISQKCLQNVTQITRNIKAGSNLVKLKTDDEIYEFKIARKYRYYILKTKCDFQGQQHDCFLLVAACIKANQNNIHRFFGARLSRIS